MHQAYGGVVPELASRDHVRRVMPAAAPGAGRGWRGAGCHRPGGLHARTGAGGGAAGGRRIGRGAGRQRWTGRRWASTTWKGTCCRPSWPSDAPQFPFIALLVSGGHTQLMQVDEVGRYTCWARLSTTPPAKPSTSRAKLLDLGYPGGPALAALANKGVTTPSHCRARCCTVATWIFQLRRPEDRCDDAAARHGPRAQRNPACRPGGIDTGRHRRRAGGQDPARDEETAASDAWWWPAASAPTAACVRTSMPLPPAEGCRCTIRRWRCAPTTAR
jgi:hypothetical protein